MNELNEDLLRRVETVGRRQASAGCIQRAFQFSSSQSNSAPLWQQARVQAEGFRPADLERAHWKKVWRSMFEV